MPLELAGQTYWTLPELLAQFPAKLRPSEATLRRYIRKGRLHAIKLGRGTIISAAAISELLTGTLPAMHTAQDSAEAAPTTRRQLAKVRPSFRRALALDKRRRQAHDRHDLSTSNVGRRKHNSNS